MSKKFGLLSGLRARFAVFHGDQRGTLSVETMIMFPMLLFVMLSMIVYIKIFEQAGVMVKTSENIADVLSRETEPLNQQYIDNLLKLTGYLARPAATVSLRVTVVQYNDTTKEYKLLWSKVASTEAVLLPATQTYVDKKVPQIPNVGDTRTLILVETYLPYTAPYIGTMFQTGITKLTYYNFVPVEPRFTKAPCWISCS